jgi:hypothetical protein
MALSKLYTHTPGTKQSYLNDELDQIITQINAIEAGTLDLTAYAKLAGRSAGQTLIGSTASGGNLTLQSSSHATKGKVLVGTSGYDEVNNRLGVGTASPGQDLSVQKTVAGDVTARFENLSNNTAARTLVTVKGDSAGFLGLLHFSSAYSTARYGITPSNWSELIGTGSGLIVAASAGPIVLAPDAAERARFESTGLRLTATDGTGVLTCQEQTATPSNPSSGVQARVYMKADKLVIQYNDAGTVRYKYLDLSGTGVTWVHTTSAP